MNPSVLSVTDHAKLLVGGCLGGSAFIYKREELTKFMMLLKCFDLLELTKKHVSSNSDLLNAVGEPIRLKMGPNGGLNVISPDKTQV